MEVAHSLLRHLNGKEALGQILEDYYISSNTADPLAWRRSGRVLVQTPVSSHFQTPDCTAQSQSALLRAGGLPLTERHHPPEDLVD